MADIRLKQSDIDGIAVLISAAGVLGGIGVFAYQMYLWLKFGQWTEMPLSTLFEEVGFDYYSIGHIKWVGVQKIVIWVLDLPLSVSLVVIGAALGGGISYTAEHYGKSIPSR